MASTLGITFGGMAQERDRRAGRDIQERTLGLQEKTFQAQQKRDLTNTALENINQMTQVALDMQANGALTNEGWEMWRSRIESTAAGAGIDPNEAVLTFDGRLAGQQSPEEAAATEGRSEAARVGAIAQATGQAPEQAEIAAGIRPEPDDMEWVLDKQNKAFRFVSQADIRAEPNRFAPPPEDGDGDAKDRQIQRILEAYASRGINMARADAIDLVDGVVVLRTNEVTGDGTLVNKFTGEERPLSSLLPGDSPAVAPPQGETLGDVARRGNVAGAVPAGKEVLSNIGGQFGSDVAEATIEDRQTFRTAQNEIIRALSINPRFPVAEMNRIRDEISVKPKVFDSTPSLIARMRSIKRSMQTRLANELAAGNDSTLNVKTRQDARAAAKDIERFLALLGNVDVQAVTDEEDELINKYLNETP